MGTTSQISHIVLVTFSVNHHTLESFAFGYLFNKTMGDPNPNAPSSRPGDKSKDRPPETARDREFERNQKQLETNANSLRKPLDQDAYAAYTKAAKKGLNGNGNSDTADGKKVPYPEIALSGSVGLMRGQRSDQQRQTGEQQTGDGRNGRNKSDQSDRLKTKDSKDKPIDRDHVTARKNLEKELEKRLSPREMNEYRERLDKMRDRILNQHTKITENGKIVGEIDQQEQFTLRLNRLTDLAQADILKDDAGKPLFTRGDITEMLKGFIKSGEKPKTNNDQGEANTCFNKARSKDAEKSVAGINIDTTIQMITTGQFLAEDVDGSKFICKVHQPSMRPDWQARAAIAGRGNHRDLAGQMADLRTSSWAQGIKGRQEAADANLPRDRGTNYYTYTDFGEKIAPRITKKGEIISDTGERVLDNRTHDFVRDETGKIVQSAGVTAKLLSNLTNVWYGNKISKDGDYGRQTIISSEEAYGKQPYMTTFKNKEEMVAHLQTLRNLGWEATACTLVANYLNGPDGLSGTAQGAHALDVELAANGKDVAVAGSWGGAHEGIKTAAEFFHWMQKPSEGHPDGRRGDRIFYSDRPDARGSGRTVRNDADENLKIGKPGDRDPGTIYAQREAAKEEERQRLAQEEKEEETAKAKEREKTELLALEEMTRRSQNQSI